MSHKSVNRRKYDLVDKFKDQFSIPYSQSKQDKQEMPNITSGLQDTPKNNPYDFHPYLTQGAQLRTFQTSIIL